MDIEKLTKLMEEMAGMPKEEFGKRLPGEKGTYKRGRLSDTEDTNSSSKTPN